MTLAFNKPEPKRIRQHLRASMPSPEVILWSKLKDRKLLGCNFRRQSGIESYAVDFYSADIKLAIELDGESHYQSGSQNYDARRAAVIRSFGIRIVRVLNDDVYENLEGVWEAIARAAREQMELLRPSDSPGRCARRAKKSVDPTPPTPPCEGGEKS
jgi:very-short-patch-repair endonuclease